MRILTLLLLSASLISLPASAGIIYGTDASGELTGTRSLNGFGTWAGNAELTWEIDPLGGGLYFYQYTFTHAAQGGLSHLVLEFSLGCDEDEGCITQGTNNPDGPHVYSAFSPPNFEMPEDIYGAKFDGFGDGDSPSSWSFVSNRAPVYGNIYLRNGGQAYAYNAGLVDLESEDLDDFVARPNGSLPPSEVPEPSTLLLIGAGLGALTLMRRH